MWTVDDGTSRHFNCEIFEKQKLFINGKGEENINYKPSGSISKILTAQRPKCCLCGGSLTGFCFKILLGAHPRV